MKTHLRIVARDIGHLTEAERQDVLSWVHAHGLDPDCVFELSTHGDQFTAIVALLDDQGRRYASGDRIATEYKGGPIVAPIPAALARFPRDRRSDIEIYALYEPPDDENPWLNVVCRRCGHKIEIDQPGDEFEMVTLDRLVAVVDLHECKEVGRG